LRDVLPLLANETIAPRSQDPVAATHAPMPRAEDWLMPATLPAGWAWRFARAVAPMRGPLAVAVAGRIIPVGLPVAHDPWARSEAPIMDHHDGTLTIRFNPGWVRFERADTEEATA
ncbi:MAG: hypothetical protein ACR2J8_03580, partial [Thermomicrobiales bacterium]